MYSMVCGEGRFKLQLPDTLNNRAFEKQSQGWFWHNFKPIILDNCTVSEQPALAQAVFKK